MRSYIRIAVTLVVTFVITSCSSTLHLYSGQRYFADEELGILEVSEQIKIYKFDGILVEKTTKTPVIKALPGEHKLEITANLSESNAVERTIFWEAVEGRIYQFALSESGSEADNVVIVDVTNAATL